MSQGYDRSASPPSSSSNLLAQRIPAVVPPTPINELLVQLSAESLAVISRLAERVSLGRRHVIQERHTTMKHVYFIESGVAALFAKAGGDRANVEIGTLGTRDFVGLDLVHGVETSSHRCAMQVAGEALRLRAADFGYLLSQIPEFRFLLLRYAHVVFIHSSQLVACNARHSLSQRLARWLLVASDRLGSDTVESTPEALSRAIAVRRAGVIHEMQRLEQAGLVRRRGDTVSIVNREGLENISCSCHRVLRAASATLRKPGRLPHHTTCKAQLVNRHGVLWSSPGGEAQS
jgi:CRP-like cAMP-binding protein